MTLTISNRAARRLWLNTQGLARSPTGPVNSETLLDLIRQLGFVQLDTIRVVARAHHHILWSRNQHFREPMLDRMLAEDRSVFEHFTHDASILPMDIYPFWRRQFERIASRIKSGRSWQVIPSAAERKKILKRVELEGPLSTRDFNGGSANNPNGWNRPPHKIALDYFWYTGVLATTHRKNFIKYYDLSERVIPAAALNDRRTDAEQLDHLCMSALQRLGFATEGELQRFWEASDLDEVKTWVLHNPKQWMQVNVQTADGNRYPALAPSNIEAMLDEARVTTSRLRIVNPFDPAIRDRARLKRLFGFDYRIEIFTPAAKRVFGYYVYPLLEGDRFVGRIEVRADRKKEVLTIENLWPEPGIRFGANRRKKLDAELERLRRFVGMKDLVWQR